MHQTGSVRKSEIDLNASPDENEHKSNHFKSDSIYHMAITELCENDFYRRSEKSKELCKSINRNINGAPQY